MSLNAAEKAAIVAEYAQAEGDTGSRGGYTDTGAAGAKSLY